MSPIICAFFFVFLSVDSKILPCLIYNKLSPETLLEAKSYGAEAYKEFLDATANKSQALRGEMYDDYFVFCNDLGQDRAKDVFQAISHVKVDKDIKLLLTLGMSSFVAKFISLPGQALEDGIRQLCEKYELQLQCQLGFGESRTAIFWRIDELKNTDGNLRILLERQCPNQDADNSVYNCLSQNVDEWSRPCYSEMLAYNYTRYSAGRRIARLHINATREVAKMTNDKDLQDDDEFLSVKEKVEIIFQRKLKEIADIEGEKCDALGKALNCVLPHLEERCGSEAAYILKTSVLIGYLSNQRREPLDSQFKGFNVDKSKKCTKLHQFI